MQSLMAPGVLSILGITPRSGGISMQLPNTRESALARSTRQRWYGALIIALGAVALVGGAGLIAIFRSPPLGIVYALMASVGFGIGLIAFGWSRIEGAVRLREVPLSPEVARVAAQRIRRAEWLWVAGFFLMLLGPLLTGIAWLALFGIGLFFYASFSYWAVLRYEREQRLSGLDRSAHSA